MKYRLVIFGSGVFGIPSFSALAKDSRFNIQAVVSQPGTTDSDILHETPTTHWARTNNFDVLTWPTLIGPAVETKIKTWAADALVVIDYGLILPQTILAIPTHGAVNVHASLLPKYRGAAPIAAAVLAGDTSSGITVIVMDAGIDTGPILGQSTWPIDSAMSAPELSNKLSILAAGLLPDTLADWLSDQRKAQPQPQFESSYVGKLTKADGRATWESGMILERKIRAYQPWPGVWTEWDHKRIKLLAASFLPATPTQNPGTVVQHSNLIWAIACHDGWLIPSRVQMAGKKPQPADTILGSYPGLVGAQLG